MGKRMNNDLLVAYMQMRLSRAYVGAEDWVTLLGGILLIALVALIFVVW